MAMEEGKENITDQQKLIDECVTLLENNHNIILTGAPGTGKTYLAKQIAAKMLDYNYVGTTTAEDVAGFNDQVRIVQFHPSYDYTDFVEGLRPVKDEDSGQIVFKRKDGVFKEFCKDAYKYSFDGIINTLIDNKTPLRTTGTEERRVDFTISSYDGTNIKVAKTNHKYKLIKKEVFVAAANDGRGVSADDKEYFSDYLKRIQDDNEKSLICYYYQSIYNKFLNLYKRFVFIIDEINRGEISKIFGELFFSIDPGYRGTKGRVRTQYQNLITDPDDVFIDGFYVPSNVYIIGTMNDIDRSVESMDFAFRRRFAFKEITADATQYMLQSDEMKSRMTNLNEAINRIDGLSPAYHIGASYFLKLEKYKKTVKKTDDTSVEEVTNDSFKDLWDYHIKGLLEEYLRGRDKLEINNIMTGLKNAYDDDTPKGQPDSTGADTGQDQ